MKKINITLVDIIVVIVVSCLFYYTYRVYLKDLVVNKLETTIKQKIPLFSMIFKYLYKNSSLCLCEMQQITY